MEDKMESALTSVEEGVGRFVYTGDGMNINLTPLVAAIIAGILLVIPVIISLVSLISIPTFSSGGSGEKHQMSDVRVPDVSFILHEHIF